VVFADSSSGSNLNQWSWYFINNDGFISSQKRTVYHFENSGTYPVAMIVPIPGVASDTIIKNIFVDSDSKIYVPNSFSPNNDGVNDTFQPKGRGIKKYTLAVYDKWGNRVYQTSDFGSGWDGSVWQ